MAGATLTASWDDRDARRALRAIERAGRSPAMLLRPIGVALVEGTQTRFERETAPDGTRWEGLNAHYATLKTGAGILRESAMRGGLQGSITFAVAGAEVAVGSAKVYAGVHQFGATIRPRNPRGLLFMRGADGKVWGVARQVTIKARPYLGISAEDEREIGDIVELVLRRLGGL